MDERAGGIGAPVPERGALREHELPGAGAARAAPGGRSAVIALFGPTGVGKTAVAVALGDLLREHGEDPVAISADALQVYRGLETLTGAASAEEQARLDHRMLSFVPVTGEFSAGAYMPLAHGQIDSALAKGRTPIVVGGTGLYLRAALSEMDFKPPPPRELRERWQNELARRGARALHAELAQRAPWAARSVDPADGKRLVRTLELLDMGELDPDEPAGDSDLWRPDTRHPTLLVGLTMDREALYARIDARMARIAVSARDEVRAADAAGASRTVRAALGFDEVLSGDLEGLQRRTRGYARRQLTWMRKLGGLRAIDVTDREPEEVAAEVARLAGRGPT